MTRVLDALRSHAADLGLSTQGPVLRRRHSESYVRQDFLTCGYNVAAKAKHHGWTGDDTCLPLPRSWKRTAFAVVPDPVHAPCPQLDINALQDLRMPFLASAEASVGDYCWVRNDATPWGVMGGRPDTKPDATDKHYFRPLGKHEIFHNEFRVWLDQGDTRSFDKLSRQASMNCSDFAALCLARAANISPQLLARFYNRQFIDEPQALTRFSYRYNHLGCAWRRPLDGSAFPGDLMFTESAQHGVQHVTILQDIDDDGAMVVECSDLNRPDLRVALNAASFANDGEIFTYVPFEIAMRTFLAHMRQPTDVVKALSYDAFLRMVPRV